MYYLIVIQKEINNIQNSFKTRTKVVHKNVSQLFIFRSESLKLKKSQNFSITKVLFNKTIVSL